MMSHEREELLQSLVERIRRVSRHVHPGRRFRFGEFMLGPPQVRILFVVAKANDGVSVKELAGMLGVTPGAVTQFVDGLVEMNLLKREEDTKDRRITRVKLTGLARAKLEEFRKGYLVSLSQVFDLLSDEEIEQLVMLLSKVNLPSDTRRVTPGRSGE